MKFGKSARQRLLFCDMNCDVISNVLIGEILLCEEMRYLFSKIQFNKKVFFHDVFQEFSFRCVRNRCLTVKYTKMNKRNAREYVRTLVKKKVIRESKKKAFIGCHFVSVGKKVRLFHTFRRWFYKRNDFDYSKRFIKDFLERFDDDVISFSKFDICDAFYTVLLPKLLRRYLIFRFSKKNYQYLRLPLGVMFSNDIFQFFLHKLFHDAVRYCTFPNVVSKVLFMEFLKLVQSNVIVYVDDFLVLNKNSIKHEKLLSFLFCFLNMFHMKINLAKMELIKKKINFLNYAIDLNSKSMFFNYKCITPLNIKSIMKSNCFFDWGVDVGKHSYDELLCVVEKAFVQPIVNFSIDRKYYLIVCTYSTYFVVLNNIIDKTIVLKYYYNAKLLKYYNLYYKSNFYMELILLLCTFFGKSYNLIILGDFPLRVIKDLLNPTEVTAEFRKKFVNFSNDYKVKYNNVKLVNTLMNAFINCSLVTNGKNFLKL